MSCKSTTKNLNTQIICGNICIFEKIVVLLHPIFKKFEIRNYKLNKAMYIFLTILIVIAAILLTLLVLVQNSKGGGLAAGFASGNQVMGAPKTADFLEKATWTLVALIVAFSIAAVGFSKGQHESAEEQSAIVVDEAPAAPAPAAELPAEPAE